jgi:hypothetical protein
MHQADRKLKKHAEDGTLIKYRSCQHPAAKEAKYDCIEGAYELLGVCRDKNANCDCSDYEAKEG